MGVSFTLMWTQVATSGAVSNKRPSLQSSRYRGRISLLRSFIWTSSSSSHLLAGYSEGLGETGSATGTSQAVLVLTEAQHRKLACTGTARPPSSLHRLHEVDCIGSESHERACWWALASGLAANQGATAELTANQLRG